MASALVMLTPEGLRKLLQAFHWVGSPLETWVLSKILPQVPRAKRKRRSSLLIPTARLPTMVSPEGVGSAAQAPPARAVGRHRADDPQPGEQTYPAPDHALGLPVLRRGRSAAHPPRTWPRMGPGAPAAARPPAGARPPWARLRRMRSIDQLTVRKV